MTTYQKKLLLNVPKDLVLFKDWLEKTRGMWLAVLRNIFASHAELSMQFTGLNTIEKVVIKKKKYLLLTTTRV